MTIECIEGRYFIAVWIIPFPERNADLLTTAYRDKATDPWTILTRAAAGNGESRKKSWAKASAPAEWSELQVEEKIDTLCRDMSSDGVFHKFEMRSDSVEKNSETMLKQPWVYVLPTQKGGSA